ncbi:DUF7532 family protein [Halobacterium litoreum]|uniref:Uncharacterized protein n=1 Tax=Halobacterium litoreum TaxID=2039234 RepID=A0ABD5NFL3_9EURY|nr:hypothetical protein [Halobacterium litoreum]UHH13012.1 hypothetical protein LT972_12720 [Halobacterium litoreum]
MLFDQRTRELLRDAGLSQDDIQRVERDASEQARETADRVESFFDGLDTVYSDMDQTHSAADYPEHDLDYVDLFTHSEDIRGFVRFDSWGAYVEDARVLSEDAVELTLGPTIHGRVRFAAEREHLE